MKCSAPAAAGSPSTPAPQPAAKAASVGTACSRPSPEPHLRAGGGRSDLGTDRPPGFARRGRDWRWAVGADHRRIGRRRHVRGPAREGIRSARHRRLQHDEGRSRPVPRRRPRDRLHARGLRRCGASLLNSCGVTRGDRVGLRGCRPRREDQVELDAAMLSADSVSIRRARHGDGSALVRLHDEVGAGACQQPATTGLADEGRPDPGPARAPSSRRAGPAAREPSARCSCS